MNKKERQKFSNLQCDVASLHKDIKNLKEAVGFKGSCPSGGWFGRPDYYSEKIKQLEQYLGIELVEEPKKTYYRKIVKKEKP